MTILWPNTDEGITRQIRKRTKTKTKKENEIDQLNNGLDTVEEVRVATISEEITQSESLVNG